MEIERDEEIETSARRERESLDTSSDIIVCEREIGNITKRRGFSG